MNMQNKNRYSIQELKPEVSEYLQQIQVIEQQIKELGENREAISVKLAQAVCGIVRPAYRQWRPKLEEQAYVVDIMAGVYSPVKVKSINGDYVRTQAVSPNHTAWYSIELNRSCDEYEIPIFIVPVVLFQEIKTLFELREF